MIARYKQERTEDNLEFEKRNQEYGEIILSYNQGTSEYKEAHKKEFERARWELTQSNLKLISRFVKRFRGFLDFELLSEGTDALYEKSEDWDYRIANISTYAGLLIRRRIIKGYYESRKGRKPLSENMLSTSQKDNPLERLIENEGGNVEKRIEDIIAVINNGVLSDMEKYVMREHYLNDRKLTEIARERGVTRERISQHHKKAIRKIQEALKSKYSEITVKPRPIVKKKRYLSSQHQFLKSIN